MSSRISKKELVKFANEFYRDNDVILYQIRDVLKSYQSTLTPISMDTDSFPNFFKDFQVITPSFIGLPEYVDFSKKSIKIT